MTIYLDKYDCTEYDLARRTYSTDRVKQADEVLSLLICSSTRNNLFLLAWLAAGFFEEWLQQP